MDSAGNEAVGSGTETAAASNESPDSRDPSGRRRGGQRRARSAATPADSRGGSARVLRARSAAAPALPSESSRAERARKAGDVQPGRGRAAGSRSRNAPVMQNESKKSAANKSSRKAPKLSKCKRGKKRKSPSRASCKRAAITCKPEAKTEASVCGRDAHRSEAAPDNVTGSADAPGEDVALLDEPKDRIGDLERKTEKPRRRAPCQQKEVKKEESDKEAESDGVKTEERVVPSDEGDDAEASRKRGRREEKGPRQPKRRKKPPVQYVRCEMEGCGTVLAHPRYLQHHIKYQHLLKKKYVCDHPSCGRLFRLQKQLLRHAKHHTDQRDYICEYCARAFKSSHNLAVHRMIHTGEKPIQCEICGFTCRQKASLNWHMKKHDAEASYRFSCSICAKKFEKKDSVVAHKAKSHPEVLIAEAMAANGGAVISPAAPVLLLEPPAPPEKPQEEAEGGGVLTPLQQVVLPLAPQTPMETFLALQEPAVVHLNATPALHVSSHLLQLSSDPHSLLTLSSVSPQQAAAWGRATGEGMWERAAEGEVMWEEGGGGGEVARKEAEGGAWEGERQILLQCAEVAGDALM